jgi:hypothetical protein
MKKEYQYKVILEPTSPKSYEDLKEMIKTNFNQDIKNLLINENTKIDENNYNNFIYSIYELSYIKRKIFIDIKPISKKYQHNDFIEMKNKYEQNKALLESHNTKYQEHIKKNQELEKKLEDIKQNLLNKNMNEVITLNQKIGQKLKIISNFEEFKNKMNTDDKELKKKINDTKEKYEKEFNKELSKILEEIKNDLHKEISNQFKKLFEDKLIDIQTSEKKLMKNFNDELERINYTKLIEESENKYDIKCNNCKKFIIGQLYQCLECNSNPYYLCEICEEKNYHETKKHPHLFIKVRKRKHSIDNEKNNKK